jgi:uncharacterized protein YjbJ (UPF0337 family)
MWAIAWRHAKEICPGLAGQPHQYCHVERASRKASNPTSQSEQPNIERRGQMNWDRVEGNWKQLTGKVKEQWGKLTEDDITVINGKQDQLVGRIQERYGIAKDEAERQVDSWVNRM